MARCAVPASNVRAGLSASTPNAAWCWPAAAFRMTSRGARRCFRMPATVPRLSRPARSAPPVMACDVEAGATLAELADRTGIDRERLPATVAAFNASADEGRDPTFGNGSRAYNRFQGDALHGPNPCIAPLEPGPFYAIKMVIGDL